LVTAPVRICAVPTLFFGMLIAAYPVPPIATISATELMTIAGDGV
jgi:hypothetical protein